MNMEELLSEIGNILGFDVTVKNVNEKLSRRYQELAKKKEKLNNVLKEGAVSLSELWVDILNNDEKRSKAHNNDQRAILKAVNISGTYNSLSRLKVLGNEWSKDQQKSFKSLIVKLAEKGREIYEQFKSRDIANTLNALSKWDIFDNRKWNNENVKLKNLIVKLVDQGIQSSTQFNSQAIANTLNALSKWDVLNNQEFKDSRGEFKSFIVKLVDQGIQSSTQFNSQAIANTLNVLPKWDVLDNQEFKDSKDKFKTLIVKLIAQGNKTFTQFNSQEIANTLNVLSKWDVLNNQEFKDSRGEFKSFIVKLVDQGIQSSTQFNSRHIANTLNALSKWNVLNSTIWTGTVQIEKGKEVNKVQLFKAFIINLAEQGNKIYKEFNSQEIANTLNALSKWDVLNSDVWDDKITIDDKQVDEVTLFKSLIVKLVDQGNDKSTQFNSQEIANTLNALSKWDVLNSDVWDDKITIDDKQVDEVTLFKPLIVKLVDQGNDKSTQFNSQDIANTFDALYKFDILDDEKWTENEQNKIKSLIVQLVKKGQEQKVLENFNSQAIANTFNAFSKLNILGNKWTSNEQEELKYFIVQLAKRGGSIEGYNLKDIAKIYSALLKWSNDADEFKSLTDKLVEQVQAIAQKQNEEDNILDNIRFTSQIITDLPELKSKKLITSDGQLLVRLMQCLSASVDKSKGSDLKRDWPKKDILSGLKGFVNIINELEDKSNLRGKFDWSIIKIFNKLSAVKLDSEYNEKIPEIINKLIEWEIIKDRDALKKFPTIGNVSQSESKVLDGKEEDNTGTALSGATISNQSPKANMQSCRGSKSKKKDKVLDGKEEDKPGTVLSGATISNQSPKNMQSCRGSKSKKKDKDALKKFPTIGNVSQSESKVLDGKEEDKPGTALSGATISNHQSPEARTQGRRGFRCECLIL